VCVTLNNGVKLPVLGYAISAKRSLVRRCGGLELALSVGYRHISLGVRGDSDLRTGKLIKSLIDAGTLTREELFISLKIHIEDADHENVRSRFLQRLYTLGCEHIDLLLLEFPRVAPDNGQPCLVRPASNMQKTEQDSLLRLWTIAESLHSEGHARSLGLVCDNHITLLNILQRQQISPHIIQTSSRCALVQKYLPNLLKLCGGRDIHVMAAISEYFDNGKSSYPQRKLLSSIAAEMERGLDQVLMRSFLERGMAVICQTNNEEVIERGFQVLDFSLHVDDMKKIIEFPI